MSATNGATSGAISDAEPGATLSVRDIRKRYGNIEAVRGVSLEINAGECVGILGPNGAGKSTTLKICLAQTEQDSGGVTLLGCDMPRERLQARQRVGVVPQQDNLDPDFDCVENLRVYARYFGLRLPPQAIDRLLEFSGLTARAKDRITTLSGGMQRRLTLARALVNDPQFIFLDEPSTGLDPQARHLIWERLRRLQSENKTLLLTTHFMEEAERLCDRVAVMDHGQIIATGTPAELVAECVERMVVEVYGSDIADWLEAHADLMARHERLGQLAYCYSNDSDALLHALQQEGRKFTCRPATLEDVFLRLTGRALRE